MAHPGRRAGPGKVLAVALWLSLALVAPARAQDAAPAQREPAGEELALRWFDQLLGFDALEAYEARSGRIVAEFSVARKWRADGARILVDVVKPQSLNKLAFLFLQNSAGSLDVWVYAPQVLDRRVRRLPALRVEFQAPGITVPIGALRPFMPGELSYERLPDTEVGGEACFAVEGHPAALETERFDRMELLLSKRTGVALETLFFKGQKVQQRITVAPEHVRSYEGHWLPERRLVVPPSGPPTELTLLNLMLDPDLPDRLFTHHNLRVQRFPAF